MLKESDRGTKRRVVYCAICINFTEVAVGADESWRECAVGWKLTNLETESSQLQRQVPCPICKKSLCFSFCVSEFTWWDFCGFSCMVDIFNSKRKNKGHSGISISIIDMKIPEDLYGLIINIQR